MCIIFVKKKSTGKRNKTESNEISYLTNNPEELDQNSV